MLIYCLSHSIITSALVFSFTPARIFLPVPNFRNPVGYLQCQSKPYHVKSSNLIVNTDSEIDDLVSSRTEHRRNRNFKEADRIKDFLDSINVELTDLPYSQGGGTTWKRIPRKNLQAEIAGTDSTEEDFLSLARSAIDIACNDKERHEPLISKVKEILEINMQLPVSERSIQGRKFADAAFYFSLAGVTDQALFDAFRECVMSEMNRFGARSSCRPLDILQMAERLAVSGERNQSVYSLAADILRAKRTGNDDTYEEAISQLSSGQSNLLNSMPLLWLWRYAASQKKEGNQNKNKKNKSKKCSEAASCDEKGNFNFTAGSDSFDHVNNRDDMEYKKPSVATNDTDNDTTEPALKALSSFSNPELPLIIEIGCGYGVNILGLCHEQAEFMIKIHKDNQEESSSSSIVRSRNFCGCDMSPKAVSYANGIASRWGLDKNCQFVVSDAESFLKQILTTYTGPVEAILINFPTPYALNASYGLNLNSSSAGSDDLTAVGGIVEASVSNNQQNVCVSSNQLLGNSQLPVNMDQFMITKKVIELCRLLLSTRSSPRSSSVNKISNVRDLPGYVLFQTNVEDVAVTVQGLFTQTGGGFRLVNDKREVDVLRGQWVGNNIDPDSDGDLYAPVDSYWEDTSTAVDGDTSNTFNHNSGGNENMFNTSDGDDNSKLRSTVRADSDSKPAPLQQADPKRIDRWIASGGTRVCGPHWVWLPGNPLSVRAKSETEAMCIHEGKPIHRVIFICQS